jgi:cell division protein FtsZ
MELIIMSQKKAQQVVSKWLRDGIEGRGLKATLYLYLLGLMTLAPAAALIGYLFGAQVAFQATPLLVLILVGVEYGLCYPEKFSRGSPRHRPNPSLRPSIALPTGGGPPRIIVIGVGGAGGSAVNTMLHEHVTGVEFVTANTDLQALSATMAPIRLQLGAQLTKGLGAGANPDIGRRAAEEDRQQLREALTGADMVFITAGLGGGTGSGAVPVIASIAREKGILTVAVVTKPFAFEGRQRMRQAEAAIHELHGHVDTLIVISNQLLLEIVDKRTSLRDAFKVADAILWQAVQGITDLVTVAGAFDFADLRKFMSGMETAGLGIGVVHGEQRVEEATRQALSNPLLQEFPVAKARRVLINVTGGSDLSLTEVHKAVTIVHEVIREDSSTLCGSLIDENIKDEARVTIIAADFDTGANTPSSRQVQLSGKRVALKCVTGTILADRTAQPPVESVTRLLSLS